MILHRQQLMGRYNDYSFKVSSSTLAPSAPQELWSFNSMQSAASSQRETLTEHLFGSWDEVKMTNAPSFTTVLPWSRVAPISVHPLSRLSALQRLRSHLVKDRDASHFPSSSLSVVQKRGVFSANLMDLALNCVIFMGRESQLQRRSWILPKMCSLHRLLSFPSFPCFHESKAYSGRLGFTRSQ